jgi:hypothetical protein
MRVDYSIIQGLLINKIENTELKTTVTVVYNLTSLFIGAKAGTQTLTSFKLSGAGLKKVIEGYAAE